MTDYDLLIVGGGLAGSALAIAMARHGARVLVVERERAFRDRIRGELVMPWGSVEAKALDIYDCLLAACGVEARYWTMYVDGKPDPTRDLTATTPRQTCCLNFPHPVMQEVLIRKAAAAGAEVRRGAVVERVMPGPTPRARLSIDGRSIDLTARLIVGADGRESKVRQWAGFDVRRDPEQLYIAGMLLSGDIDLGSTVHYFVDDAHGRASIVAQTAPDLCRIYLIHHKNALPRRLSGERDVATAFEQFRAIGVPPEWLRSTRQTGPFATFDGAHRWVERPHRDGIVLVGDAAGASDPSWGNGLSRTLRDVRLLRDRLSADDDWDRAACAYAADHDAFFDRLHELESMQAELYMEIGAAADQRRARIYALIKEDRSLQPDSVGLGPEASGDRLARLLREI